MLDHLRTVSVDLEDLRQLAGELRLYAILDACNAPAIQSKVAELGSARALCLYRGEVTPEILEVAPYLVRIDNTLLQWLVKTVWSDPWGIFVIANLDPNALRKHFRKFLIVKSEAEEVMYFRYYDPRVLPTFLSSCNQKELATFFADLTAFGASIFDGSTSILLMARE